MTARETLVSIYNPMSCKISIGQFDNPGFFWYRLSQGNTTYFLLVELTLHKVIPLPFHFLKINQKHNVTGINVLNRRKQAPIFSSCFSSLSFR